MSETRFVNCPTCGGEGFVEYLNHPVGGYWRTEPRYRAVDCETCAGTCEIEVEVEPLDEDDLQEPSGRPSLGEK